MMYVYSLLRPAAITQICRAGSRFLFYGNGFDFAEDAFWQFLYGNAAARWFGGKVSGINFVKYGEISHIRQKAGRFYDVAISAAGRF